MLFDVAQIFSTTSNDKQLILCDLCALWLILLDSGSVPRITNQFPIFEL